MTRVKTPPPLWTLMTDGAGEAFSWSRAICTTIVVFSLAWGTYIVYLNKVIPDFTSVALLLGAVYGVNRLGEAWEKKPNAPAAPPPASPVQQNVTVEGDQK